MIKKMDSVTAQMDPGPSCGSNINTSRHVHAYLEPSGSSVADALTGTARALPDSAIDFRSMLDDLGVADAQEFYLACSPDSASQVRCARLSQNIPPALVSRDSALVVRDFQQGARTKQFFADVSHHVAAAAAVPQEFFGSDESGGGGTEWAVTTWTPDLPFLSFGVALVMSRTILNTQDVRVAISNDPNVPFTGGVERPLPPVGWKRQLPLVRGRTGNTLVVQTSSSTFAVILPWMWRAPVAMDTAAADLGLALPVTPAQRAAGGIYNYMSNGTTAPPAGAVVYANSLRVTSSAPLSLIRAMPITNNQRALVSALRFLVG